MTFQVSVKSDIRRMTRDLDALQQNKVPRAVVTALNRTNTRFRTQVIRALQARFNISPQKRIRRRVMVPAKLKATRNRLVASGLTLFNYVPEAYFHKLTAKGDRAAVSGPNRFVAVVNRQTGKGHTGIFQRTTQKRLPIKEVLRDVGDEVVQVTDRLLRTTAARIFVREFDRALKRILRTT